MTSWERVGGTETGRGRAALARPRGVPEAWGPEGVKERRRLAGGISVRDSCRPRRVRSRVRCAPQFNHFRRVGRLVARISAFVRMEQPGKEA